MTAYYLDTDMFRTHKLILTALLLCASLTAHATDISGSGSSAAKLLYAKLSASYSKVSATKLQYQPIGSAGGLKQAKERSVDFGASDVALSAAEQKSGKLICFPTAISGVVPVFNLPGIKSGELLLTGEVLADIFSRKITKWNDPQLQALNPRLALPASTIVVVVRQDGSGSTYHFTDYLSKRSPAWAQSYGRKLTIAWPADTTAVQGSAGVVAALKQTSGAIGYVDFSYVQQDRLAYAKLRNHDGKVVAPQRDGFAAALANSGWKNQVTFEETLSDKPGDASWPITMGTFIILNQAASNPQRTIATLMFFTWAFMNGNPVVDEVNFVRLPDVLKGRIYNEFTKLTDMNGNALEWSLQDVMNQHL